MPTDCDPCPGKTIPSFMASPSYQHRAPREAAADACEHDVMTDAYSPVAHGDIQGQGNRCRRSVCVLVDRRYHALTLQPQLLHGCVHDAHVGLMGNEPVDLPCRESLRRKRLLRLF